MKNATDFLTGVYVAPVMHVVQLVTDHSFLYPASGMNEDYGPSENYGDEWL